MLLHRLGDHALHFVEQAGWLGIFLANTLLRVVTPPFRLMPIVKQIHFIGARSWLVIVVSGTFVGMVVALQFYDTLVRFGSVSLLGSAVGLSLIRELGPHGFILQSGCDIPANAKLENVRAMVAAAIES